MVLLLLKCANERCAKNFTREYHGGRPIKFCSDKCCNATYKRKVYRQKNPVDKRLLPMPESTREKLRIANLGKVVPRAQVEKMAATRIRNGKGHSDIARKNISLSLKGHVVSAAAKKKMRAAKIGKKLSPGHKANMRAGRRRREEVKQARKSSWMQLLSGEDHDRTDIRSDGDPGSNDGNSTSSEDGGIGDRATAEA